MSCSGVKNLFRPYPGSEQIGTVTRIAQHINVWPTSRQTNHGPSVGNQLRNQIVVGTKQIDRIARLQIVLGGDTEKVSSPSLTRWTAVSATVLPSNDLRAGLLTSLTSSPFQLPEKKRGVSSYLGKGGRNLGSRYSRICLSTEGLKIGFRDAIRQK